MLSHAPLLIFILSLSQVLATSPPTDCGHPAYECVPYFICIDGVIDTSGVGLINIRVRPTSQCVNPDDPTAPGVCCQIPDDPHGPPQDECSNPNYVCQEYTDCLDNAVNTDGAGLIDIRTVPRQSCWSQSGRIGSCCPPKIVPIECPFGSYCKNEQECFNGQIYDEFSQFLPYGTVNIWSVCETPNYELGICCIPPPVEFCPSGSYCVGADECSGNAYDYTQNLNPYASTGSWLLCNIPDFQPGVCCDIPPYIEVCPTGSDCVAEFECLGDALVEQSVDFSPYVHGGAWGKCFHLDYKQGGVCCKYTAPRTDCPHGSRCVPGSRCYGPGLASNDGWPIYSPTGSDVWQQCYLSEYENGVCCQPPYARDDCPFETACLPQNNCEGTIMDYSEIFHPYNEPSHDWASCFIHEYEDGVCCEPKVVIPPATQCGIRNDQLKVRITTGGNPVVGKEAEFGELPWQVIVFNSNYTFICGATVISNSFVITAAHCVHDKAAYDIKLRFGEWQVNSFDEPEPYVDIGVSNVIVHEAFTLANVWNDIALLELDVPLTFKYHISPICLPHQGQIYPEYQRCITSGWGKDSFERGKYQHILKKIDVPIVSKAECQADLRKTRLTRFFKLHKSFMCAGGEKNIDACKGDGGGPLVCENPDYTWSLVGITAWGIGCGQEGIPGVYVDVGHFADWIAFNTQHQTPSYG